MKNINNLNPLDSGNYWHNIVVELNADYEKVTPDCYKLPKVSKC